MNWREGGVVPGRVSMRRFRQAIVAGFFHGSGDEVLFGEPGEEHLGQARVLALWRGGKGGGVAVDEGGVCFSAVAEVAVGVGGATVVDVVEFFH